MKRTQTYRRSKPLILTYHVKNAEGRIVKKKTLQGSLDVHMQYRERIKANLPTGHTLELANDIIGRSEFSRK